MSKEKQIEEMAEAILRMVDNYDTTCREDCETISSLIYNAGYRKQSEGEWVRKYDKAPRYMCTACNHLYNNKEYNYCPNCGAKMKGGAE